MSKQTHYVRIGLVALIALLVVIQLVPYGRNHTNPPVVSEPNWNTSETRTLAQRACFDCHSNETVWPWYSNVAPMSWLVQHDVEEARSKMNFSDWGAPRAGEREDPADEVQEVIREGEMPPLQYTAIHATARLSTAEREQLISGLMISLAQR